MPSTSETGHAINVDNFELLISHCIGYGAAYNPSQAAIMVTALNTVLTNARASLKTLTEKLEHQDAVINIRQLPYELLPKLVTRLVSALDSSGKTHKAVADARTIARKITGKRAIPKKPSGKKKISTSQRSFTAVLENFKKFVALLQEEPLYNPNETDLKTSSLNNFIAQLIAYNTDVINATTDVDNARTNRDHILYDPDTGLYDIAKEVKKYVKSVFGANSSEFKQISSIRFTRPKK